MNFQAMILVPNKRSQKRLREVLKHLYQHLDNSALSYKEGEVSKCKQPSSQFCVHLCLPFTLLESSFPRFCRSAK